MKAANDRLQPGTRAALAKQDGLLLSNETTILLLGTDTGPQPGRAGNRHSDSIMLAAHGSVAPPALVPLDPARPARAGAAASATRRSTPPSRPAARRSRSGRSASTPALPINHVVVVDFANFEELIDAEGGITIDVPAPILSNKFDCPYNDRRAVPAVGGLALREGQAAHGRPARARSTRASARTSSNPRETRLHARGAAAGGDAGGDVEADRALDARRGCRSTATTLLKPLATDLSAWQIIQLGWVKNRASGGNTLYCRLGGDPSSASGQSVIIPSEDNRNAIAMWQGDSAPQRPTTTYGPGCVKGRPLR